MNKGLMRGLGLPGGLTDPVAQLWVGGNPLINSIQESGDFGGALSGTTPTFYLFGAARQNKPATPGVQFGLEERRFVQTNNTTSGIFGDNNASLKVWMQPTFAPGVTDWSLTGISVAGFIGAGSSNTLANSKMCAYGTHLDTEVAVFGMYGLQIHLGLIGVNATETVGVDLNAMNSIVGSYTDGIFLRNRTGNMAAVIRQWNMQVGPGVSQHRGTLGVGAVNDTVMPGQGGPNAPSYPGQSPTQLESQVQPIISPGNQVIPEALAILGVPTVSPFSVSAVSTTGSSAVVTSSAAFGSVTQGMAVGGIYVPQGTTVQTVTSASSLTLSQPVQHTDASTKLVFGTIDGVAIENCVVTGASTAVTGAGFNALTTGMYVTGPGILATPTTITVNSNTSITLSTAPAFPLGQSSLACTLTFYTNMPVRAGWIPGQVTTTTTGGTVMWQGTAVANALTVVHGRIWARRTGGSSGSANDAVAFEGNIAYINGAVMSNTNQFAPVPQATLPGSFTVASSTTAVGSTTVTSSSAFGSVKAGMAVTGTGIPSGAYVVSVTSSSSIQLSIPANAAGTVTLTFCGYYISTTAGYGFLSISANGPATTNVTWHGIFEVLGPLVT